MPSKEHINPDELSKNPAFSQVVSTQGHGKTIYIGGQNAVNKYSEIIGKGSLPLQTEQVMRNLKIALASCGATFNDLVKINISLVHGHDLRESFIVSQKFLSSNEHPPAVTVQFVSALAHPDYLIEIDAIAFIVSI